MGQATHQLFVSGRKEYKNKFRVLREYVLRKQATATTNIDTPEMKMNLKVATESPQ